MEAGSPSVPGLRPRGGQQEQALESLTSAPGRRRGHVPRSPAVQVVGSRHPSSPAGPFTMMRWGVTPTVWAISLRLSPSG